MVISFCNEKGGCGKSTLALFLSGRLAEDGDDVLLIDADPQNSTSVFVESRNKAELKQTFSTISKNGDTLKNEIKANKYLISYFRDLGIHDFDLEFSRQMGLIFNHINNEVNDETLKAKYAKEVFKAC